MTHSPIQLCWKCDLMLHDWWWYSVLCVQHMECDGMIPFPSQFISHSFFLFLSCHRTAVVVVVVKVCCRPKRLSPQFSMAVSKRATRRSCRLNLQFETQWGVKSPLWAAALRSEPLNRRLQRFLFTRTVLSFTGSFHVDISECGIIVVLCFHAECGSMGKRSGFTQSESFCLHSFYTLHLTLRPHLQGKTLVMFWLSTRVQHLRKRAPECKGLKMLPSPCRWENAH